MRTCALALLFFFHLNAFATSDLPPSSVIYGVAPTLFGAKPFAAVTAKLDEFHSQGVDALWLAPLNPTDDPGAISYQITDFFGVRSDFGTADELRTLVREAHARKIKVLIDFVPNHSSKGHAWFQDAERNGKSSSSYAFYDRDGDGNPTHYFDWAHLPNLNYANPQLVQLMTDAFVHWVRDFGIDGFRVDAAWGIRERAPAFWPQLIATLEKLNPRIIMLAEASAKDPYYCGNGFDLAYDWTEELGVPAWRGIFDHPEEINSRLSDALTAPGCPQSQVARFLNNNDTGERFITRYGAALTRVAAVLQHTVPGIAVVYNGDEFGAEFEPYEDPQTFNWQDAHGLKPLYKRLALLRHTYAPLAQGSYSPLEVANNGAVFAFERRSSSESALVVLNFGQSADVEIDLPESLRARFRFGQAQDLLSSRSVEVRKTEKGARVKMAAQSALILANELTSSSLKSELEQRQSKKP